MSESTRPTGGDAAATGETTHSTRGAGALDRILEEMLSGRAAHVDELAAQHPELAEEIQRLAHVLEFVQGAAAQRGSSSEALDARVALGGGRPRLGDFELGREIARGGMGVVYEAVQKSLDRRVALKVMLPGIGLTGDALERFEREARTAGGMQHAHIVPVYAVGEEDGVPYYAMQYVEGQSLAAWLKSARAADFRPDEAHARQVAQWGVQAAEALDYAHRRGVIHRDIKPSNMLLDAQDQVWLTDFGLARQDSNLTITISGDIIGTVRYMSPEQARGGSGVIDERTDVYSLGVSLYELLALQPPFEGGDRESTLKRVLLDEPRPLRQINRAVPRPLETIVLKAMEKEPQRRYPSAAILAADLRRFLRGEPLVTRPPGVAEQFARLVSRHKVPFAALAGLFAVVLGFGIWMSVLYGQAEQLRSSAERERTAAVKARDAEATARRSAESAAEKARRIQAFLEGMLSAIDPQVARGRDAGILLDMLAQAERALEADLGDRPEIAGSIHETIGSVYLALGRNERAEPHLVAAERLLSAAHGQAHPEVMLARNRLGRLRHAQGQAEAAEAFYHSVLAASESLGPAGEVLRLDTLGDLGSLLFERGRIGAAEPMLREALAGTQAHFGAEHPKTLTALSNLAALLRQQGELEEVEQIDRAVLAAREKLSGPDDPRVYVETHNLARLLHERGQLEEAERLYRRTVDNQRRLLGASHPATLTSMQSLGIFLASTSRAGEAEPLLREALAAQRTALGAAHPDTAQSLFALARLHEGRAEPAVANALYEEYLAARDAAGLAPDENLVLVLTNLGFNLMDLGKFAEGEPLFARLVEITPQVYPPDDWRGAMGRNHYGRFLTAAGQFARAEPLLLQSYEVFRSSADCPPVVRRGAAKRLAALYDAWGKPGAAEPYRTPE